MLTDEMKKNAQNVGLDLTNDPPVEIISGYMHFEKLEYIDETNISESLK